MNSKLPNNNNMARIITSDIEIKMNDTGSGIVEGYAAVYDNIDYGNDILRPGTFTKSIKEIMPSGKLQLFDSHMHDAGHLLANVTDASEDHKGVFYKANLSSCLYVQDIRTKIKEGLIKYNSIGYIPLPNATTYKRHDNKVIREIKEAKLFEISIVVNPMNILAEITNIKSNYLEYADTLRIAPKTTVWSEGAAISRIKDWSTAIDCPNLQYQKAFLHVKEGQEDQFKSFELPIADIVEGKLRAIPKALIKAAIDVHENKVLMNNDIKIQIKNKLEHYLGLLDIDPPWLVKSIETDYLIRKSLLLRSKILGAEIGRYENETRNFTTRGGKVVTL